MYSRKVSLWMAMAIAFFSINQLQAQRSNLAPALAPFYHGVASGDPTSSSVIIWTRVTTTNPSASVTWTICEDINLTTNCQTNTLTTDANSDYTVKQTVNSLNPNTYYYYVFSALGKNSVVGRTKTLPTGNTSHVRLGVVSCSSYSHGYFHGYEELTNSNDVDVILHLGDYIYEYGTGEYGSAFDYEPATEITSLSDYRTRYSFYRLDPAVRNLHQQYPFINIWDDHESADNSYRDGAANHTEGAEGNWVNRKSFSKQAYDEWLPVSNVNPLYRDFQFGDLLDLYMLDTRLEERELELSSPTPFVNQGQRTLLGLNQKSWLINGLDNSSAIWQFIGQQVMFAPFNATAAPVNMDQWDGYVSERQEVVAAIQDVSKGIDNVVVLTGDIHTSWANEIPAVDIPVAGTYDCNDGVGVEFVATSVTSPGLSNIVSLLPATIQTGNPHMRYVDLEKKGYLIMDITPTKVQGDWYYTSDVTAPTYSITSTMSYSVNVDETCLQLEAAPTPSPADRTNVPQPAPTPFPAPVAFPVELLYFDGWNEGKVNVLKWETETEINNDHFILEKSQDGRTFEFLTKIAGQGTTTKATIYQFEDKNIQNGTVYYRLKQVDLDGTFTYSPIVSIQNNDGQTTAAFFPNPCKNQFFCTLNAGVSETILIEVVDQTGKIIFQKETIVEAGFQKIEMNFTDLPNGVHVVRLKHSSNGAIEQSVFLKM